jgi:ammonium transporter Rh
VFVRVNLSPDTTLDYSRYPAFQDVNVMMLMGFGFLMTFIRSYAWSAIAWTFLINAFVAQLYILFEPFWYRVLYHGFHEFIITIDIFFLIKCSYSVASVLVSFGGLIGRVGPKDIVIIGTIHMIGYTLN